MSKNSIRDNFFPEFNDIANGIFWPYLTKETKKTTWAMQNYSGPNMKNQSHTGPDQSKQISINWNQTNLTVQDQNISIRIIHQLLNPYGITQTQAGPIRINCYNTRPIWTIGTNQDQSEQYGLNWDQKKLIRFDCIDLIWYVWFSTF